MSNASDIPAERFGAMTRLDENRAVAQLAQKLGVGVDDVQDLVVWGNHSPTMFPDLFNAKVNGQNAADQVDMDWYENEYIPRVGKRGAEIIEARGASSAASAANAAIDCMRDWVAGADGLRSMAVRSGGQYGVEEGLMSSFPLRFSGGDYEIVEGQRGRRLRPGQDRRDGERAQRGARRRQGPGPRLTGNRFLRKIRGRGSGSLAGVPAAALLAHEPVLLQRRAGRGRGSSAGSPSPRRSRGW